jgi:predicted nucleotidyltransferase
MASSDQKDEGFIAMPSTALLHQPAHGKKDKGRTRTMDRPKYYRASSDERRRVIETVRSVMAEEREILFAFVHGSFVTEPLFRDVDVGIFVSEAFSHEHRLYETILCQKVEKAIDRKFPADVKIINDAPLSFRFHVIRGSLLFAKDEEFVSDYMAQAARKYLDMAPLRRHYIHEAMTS